MGYKKSIIKRIGCIFLLLIAFLFLFRWEIVYLLRNEEESVVTDLSAAKLHDLELIDGNTLVITGSDPYLVFDCGQTVRRVTVQISDSTVGKFCLYYDSGSGFNENDTVLASLKDGAASFAIHEWSGVRQIRLDAQVAAADAALGDDSGADWYEAGSFAIDTVILNPKPADCWMRMWKQQSGMLVLSAIFSILLIFLLVRLLEELLDAHEE